MSYLNLRHGLAVLCIAGTAATQAQCPRVFDFYGSPSASPYWYSCSGTSFSFNLQSPDNWGAYTINWGDGTPNSSGSSWNSPAVINHLYAAAVDTFVVTITEVNTGCEVEGVVVMEQATSASIQIPVGGLTQACAPQVMEFINSSTNVSETTIFTWDFGDGSPQLVFDHTNWQQTVSHLYDVGTVDCETVVSLTAENYCNTIQGGESEATFNPIRIWDLDDPGITASATLLCYPDTTVTFLNTTERNCFFQGNIYQRYEHWNFGDYWGLGHDSIIDWTPWPPTFPQTMHYPGIGTYTVELLDSNFCGIAPTSITIQIVPPPVAGIGASADTVCVGEPITFYQLATGTPNSWRWNFGTNPVWIPTGPGNITYTFNQPGTYLVQNEVSIAGASGSCSDVASIQVVVLPRPSVQINATPTTACAPADIQFVSSGTNAVQWEWQFDVAPVTFSGPNPPLVHYAAPGVHTATLTVTGSNGCTASDDVLVNIHPQLEAGILASGLCAGDTASFLDNTIAAPATPVIGWSWDFGDGSTSTEQNPGHLYSAPGQYEVSLQVSSGYCQDSTSVYISVYEVPQAQASASALSGCSPLEVHFASGGSGALDVHWDFGDGAESSDPAPVHTFVNTTTQDLTYAVALTVTNIHGCHATDSLQVDVLAKAVAAFTDNSAVPACSPFDAVFLNQSQNAVGYEWDFGDGATSAAVNPTHTYSNTSGFVQTYEVSLTALAANGCHDTISDPLIVFPLAQFDVDLAISEGCSPLTLQMPFVPGVQAYAWDFGDGGTSSLPVPVHQFVNDTQDPVSYTVSLIATSPFGCADTAFSEVTVFPRPVAQFLPSVVQGCSPLEVVLTNLSMDADSFAWSYGDGSSSSESQFVHGHTFVNLTSQNQTFNIALTVSSVFGCSSVFQVPVTVYPQVSASFQDPGPRCSPADIQFVNTSANAAVYEWNFGNGLSSADFLGSTTFFNVSGEPVEFPVTLMATSAQGCSGMFTLPVTIHPLPVASFSLSESEACSPAPVQITNLSTGGSSFLWNYGDGTSSLTGDLVHTHVYSGSGFSTATYPITLLVTSAAGCTAQAATAFNLYPSVMALFAVNGPGCSPHSAVFVNQSVGAGNFTWSFGDGSASAVTNPTHTYLADGVQDLTYQATLVASNAFGCTDTASAAIAVFHRPEALALVDSLFGCSPQSATFFNGSSGADAYQWVYGNGQVSTTSEIFHTVEFFNYTEVAVTYEIVLHANTDQGCTDSDQLEITVAPDFHADFTIDAEGCTPLQVYFDNNSEGAFSWHWDFGDGDISNLEEPVHTFFNWGSADTVFNVSLVIQNMFGCTDTADAFVQVYPVPVAGFEADPVIQIWPEATVSLHNTTVGGNLNFIWSMGDGTQSLSAEPGAHSYASWGDYTIQLQAGNGSCADTAYRQVTILPPPPVAAFEGPAEGCAPLTVHFANLSQYALSSSWQFGDGGEANATHPVYTYYQPGTYTVTLTVTGYDGSTAAQVQEFIIRVYPRATAAFTVTPPQVAVPSQPVYCLNLSMNAGSYFWDFGDGTTSLLENPVHLYQEEGLYDILLVANNAFNCPDTMRIAGAVYARESGFLDFPNAFTPRTGGSSGGAYDPMSFENDVFFPLHQGVAEYQLQVFNKWGELLFESRDVNRGWDGYYRGVLCRQDVYVWKVKARFVDGQRFERAGDVTLLVR